MWWALEPERPDPQVFSVRGCRVAFLAILLICATLPSNTLPAEAQSSAPDVPKSSIIAPASPADAIIHLLAGVAFIMTLAVIALFFHTKKLDQERLARKESEDRFRQIAEHIREVVYLTDWRERKELYVSPLFENVWGMDVQRQYDDVLAWTHNIHPDDKEEAIDRFERECELGLYDMEYRILHPDGSTRWIHDQAFPIRNEQGEVVRIAGVSEDITDRKKAEQELATYREQLEKLVEKRTSELENSRAQLRLTERLASIGTLAAGIAHELNNPVGGIQLAAQNALALKAAPEAERLIESCLNDIIENTKRCKHITRSILRFTGMEQSEKWECNLGTIIKRAVELTHNYASSKGGAVKLSLEDNLPLVLVNPVEMEQVFVNLIRNSVEAGMGAVRISIETSCTEEAVAVVVRDDGRGIPEDKIKYLFDPFFTTRREKGGVGLGLSITHGIIADHNGTIEVESTEDVETAFAITLPRARTRTEEAEHVENPNR